jgi:hypothetical protein
LSCTHLSQTPLTLQTTTFEHQSAHSEPLLAGQRARAASGCETKKIRPKENIFAFVWRGRTPFVEHGIKRSPLLQAENLFV